MLKKIKNLLLACARLLVTFAYIINDGVNTCLLYMLVYTGLNPYLKMVQKPDKIDREQAIKQILSAWDRKINLTVQRDRQKFEATKWGQQAKRSCSDRHLYVVLLPSRKENLERIANVLRAMDDEAFAKVVRNAERWMMRHSPK